MTYPIAPTYADELQPGIYTWPEDESLLLVSGDSFEQAIELSKQAGAPSGPVFMMAGKFIRFSDATPA